MLHKWLQYSLKSNTRDVIIREKKQTHNLQQIKKICWSKVLISQKLVCYCITIFQNNSSVINEIMKKKECLKALKQ